MLNRNYYYVDESFTITHHGSLSGVVWIAEQIQERTNTEFDDQENLHKQLLNLQLSFDLGEVNEEDFETEEEELLLRIQALQDELEAEANEDLVLLS